MSLDIIVINRGIKWYNRLNIDILACVEFHCTCTDTNTQIKLYKMSLEYPHRQYLPEVVSNYMAVEQQSMLYQQRAFGQCILAISRQ